MNTSCSDTVKCRLDAGESPISISLKVRVRIYTFRSRNGFGISYVYVRKSERVNKVALSLRSHLVIHKLFFLVQKQDISPDNMVTSSISIEVTLSSPTGESTNSEVSTVDIHLFSIRPRPFFLVSQVTKLCHFSNKNFLRIILIKHKMLLIKAFLYNVNK